MNGVSHRRRFFFEKDSHFTFRESDLPYRLNKKSPLPESCLWENDYLCAVNLQDCPCGNTNNSNRKYK